MLTFMTDWEMVIVVMCFVSALTEDYLFQTRRYE
jgi:hypothetical protein